MEKEERIKSLSMFYPKTKSGILSDYPELRKIDVFQRLSPVEILFVWYFACKSSPFMHEDDAEERMKLAINESFGKKAPEVMGAFVAGRYSEKIRSAILEMQKFEIGPRIRAKLMIEKIMKNYEELIDIDVDTEFKDKDQEEDWTKKKAYIDSCAKISSVIPMLITQSEGSFGLTEKEAGKEVTINSDDLIEKFHQTQP